MKQAYDYWQDQPGYYSFCKQNDEEFNKTIKNQKAFQSNNQQRDAELSSNANTPKLDNVSNTADIKAMFRPLKRRTNSTLLN